jgi:hypothetical protein
MPLVAFFARLSNQLHTFIRPVRCPSCLLLIDALHFAALRKARETFTTNVFVDNIAETGALHGCDRDAAASAAYWVLSQRLASVLLKINIYAMQFDSKKQSKFTCFNSYSDCAPQRNFRMRSARSS